MGSERLILYDRLPGTGGALGAVLGLALIDEFADDSAASR